MGKRLGSALALAAAGIAPALTASSVASQAVIVGGFQWMCAAGGVATVVGAFTMDPLLVVLGAWGSTACG